MPTFSVKPEPKVADAKAVAPTTLPSHKPLRTPLLSMDGLTADAHHYGRSPLQRQIMHASGDTAPHDVREGSGHTYKAALPHKLQSGIQALSGLNLDYVKVHYNSPKPAGMNALAYAQDGDIHLGPSQEHYLPHEAWHVVQQRQGRVKPTTRVDGVHVNDDEGLEHEADLMGQKALLTAVGFHSSADNPAQPSASESGGSVRPAEALQHVATTSSPHTVQLTKGDKDDASEQLIGGQLVVRSNVETNLALLSNVWRFLPPAVRVFLNEIYGELTGKEGRVESASSGEHAALMPRDRQQDTPMMRILNLDPRIIQNVVVGLYMMPASQQRTLRTMELPGLMSLFSQLATAKYSVPLALDAPPEGIRTGRTGAEHVGNSCYAAAILNIIASSAYYRRMFDPMQNPTQEDSDGRLIQDTVLPLIQRIHAGGTVTAVQMQTLIANLHQVDLLLNVNEQQDASQVLMGMLNLIRPTQSLTTRETRVYDNHAPDQVQDENEFVLQLYAHGQRTLLDALREHFVHGVHSSLLHAEPLTDPHTVTRVITGFPEMLAIGIVRLDAYDSINMPRQFTIPGQITHNRLPGPTYRLTSYVVRNTISHKTGGHYIAVVGNDDGSWDAMDDMGTPKQGELGVWSPSTERVDPALHRVGDHHAPSYAMATLYTYRRLQPEEVEHGGATTEFDSSWMTQNPVLSDLLMGSGLSGKALKERERLVDKFLKSGGTIWDAYQWMAAWPSNNDALKRQFDELEKRRPSLSYRKEEASDPMVQGLLQGFASSSISELLRLQKETQGHLKSSSGDHAQFLRQQLIALELSISALHAKASQGYEKFFEASNSTGMKVEVYGTDRMLTNHKAAAWAHGVALTLVNTPQLASRRPPLQIRINLRPEVNDDIANTIGHGNIINVNMDDYQATHFSIGESLGLLAHELGVHSLEQSTMSKEELTTEDKDRLSMQSGKHGGKRYTVGRDPTAKKQQDDHLTIGRAILGQPSALPRLQMYERTMLSMLQTAPSSAAQREMAAAYCIDVARIIVLNDQSNKVSEAGFFGKISIADDIATAAAAEWERIQKKYGKEFPGIGKIEISYWDVGKYLLRLKDVLDKVNKEANKKGGP